MCWGRGGATTGGGGGGDRRRRERSERKGTRKRTEREERKMRESGENREIGIKMKEEKLNFDTHWKPPLSGSHRRCLHGNDGGEEEEEGVVWVIQCKTAKEIWDALETRCQGTNAIKKNRRTILTQ
ncbi:hypothetical protein AgCh_025552 [Apium graveolens]